MTTDFIPENIGASTRPARGRVMTAAEVGWRDPGSDPPHEWEHTRTRLEEAECALAGMVHENNELRAIIRRVREYAQLNRSIAEELRAIDCPYDALPYDATATALERIIGGEQ